MGILKGSYYIKGFCIKFVNFRNNRYYNTGGQKVWYCFNETVLNNFIT